ncbi:MAG: DNA-3-methyladenine glycosylase 2 [Oscillospiraceae bacterium]|nr:DNA-3-methyladenine glycosylase 2 [Oscillospiraceae bacterium]
METFIKTGPFNPALTLTGGQAFRWARLTDTTYRGIAHGRVITVTAERNGIRLIGADPADLPLWREYFDAETDYAAITRCFSSDKILREACKFAQGLRLLRQEPFETLISFIISQNNNISRIRKIIDTLCRNFGAEIQKDCYGFPTAETLAGLDVAALAPLKAGYRAGYIINAARAVLHDEINLRDLFECDTTEARQRLMKFKGVGEKVADCVLLFAYGKATFPKDVWIKKALGEFYPDGLPDCIRGNEGNAQGIAQQYLFEFVRNRKT